MFVTTDLKKLKQNKPNPFKESTKIEFIIDDFTSASIIIFDISGSLLKTYPIERKGENSIVINGYEFKPGMYNYTLIVDQKIIDTKKMILIK